MAWQVEYTRAAEREIDRLDATVRARILKSIDRAVAPGGDLTAASEPLVGEWTGHRRFRVGDWRIIFRIEAERITIVVVKVGHRGRIYR